MYLPWEMAGDIVISPLVGCATAGEVGTTCSGGKITSPPIISRYGGALLLLKEKEINIMPDG